MPNVTITCPHCSYTFTTNHNISSGSNSCKKCRKMKPLENEKWCYNRG